LKVSGEQIDLAYIERMAGQFNVADAWHKVLERAKTPDRRT